MNQLTKKFRSQRYAILPLILLGLVELVRGGIFIAFVPSYVTDQLKATVLISGAIISAQYAADTISKPFSGWLIDYLGPRLGLIFTLPLCICGIFIFLCSKSESLLICGAVLYGVGGAAVWPSVVSIMLDKSPDEGKAGTMSTIYVAWLSGIGIGILLVNFLYHLGPQLIIYIMLGVTFLPAVMAFGMPKKPVEAKIDRQGQAVTQFHTLLRGLWKFRVLLPGAFTQTLSLSMLLPVLQPWCLAHLGLNQAAMGVLIMIGGALALAFLVPLGKLVDRLGYQIFLVGGFALAGVLLNLIVRSSEHLLIYSCAVLLGLAYACILPAWNGFIAYMLPPHLRASLYSMVMSIEGLGIAAGPVLGGKISVSYGSNVLFYITSVVLLVMACFYFLLFQQRGQNLKKIDVE
jgi:DHA1 family multidrug resistance protein-like MFS transporter